MIPHRWKFIIAVFVLLGTTGLLGVYPGWSYSSPPSSRAPLQQSEALQAINAAQDAINTAYMHVRTADATGAPVSDLISSLNDAIGILNQARREYDAANYGQAITLANSVQIDAEAVTNEAQTRSYSVTLQLQIQLTITIALIVIVVVILYFAITRWQRYRKQKKREFLQMRIQLPEKQLEAAS
ncbi:MAG: hypothetical protein ACFE89_11740 [Candidatus Hodarchaeota archaeon]